MPVKAPKPVPEGMSTVTPQLLFNGNCLEAIEFYKKAFGAFAVGTVAHLPGSTSVLHAMIRIGDTNIMMSDATESEDPDFEHNHINASMFMYVENCDAVFYQAVKAGCRVIHEMEDTYWGDRMGSVKDPFGHIWGIASYHWILSPDEITRGQEEWMKSCQ